GGDGLAAVVPLQHEHRVDQVVHGEAGLPDQAAHEIGAAVAAGAGVGVGAALAGKGHVCSSTAGAMLCGPAIIRKKGAPHMSIAYGCVLIAIILPFIWAGVAKSQYMKSKNYDNHNPRLLLDQLQGPQQRANWAQQNAFEALPGFIGAVVIAQLAGVSVDLINSLAVIFIIA